MWFLHNLIGRVLFQMSLLMVLFSVIQIARQQAVNKTYFTGVLFSGVLAILAGATAFLGLIMQNRSPNAIHVAYGLVSMFALPTIYHFEQRSSDQKRALHLYTVAFVVLAISVWRGLATIG